MPAGDRVEGGVIERTINKLPEAVLSATVKAAEAVSYTRGFEEERRLRLAALELVGEAVKNYEVVDPSAVGLWRDVAKAMAVKKDREGVGKGVSNLEKSCLGEIVAREIEKPYRYAQSRGWRQDMGEILHQSTLPGAFGSVQEKKMFIEGVRRSLDLTSLVNQEMPWRLFCQLNLSAKVGESEKEQKEAKPEVMRSTFMSSRSVNGLFREIGQEDEEAQREAMDQATKLADVCLLEAALGEVATGVKTWDLEAAARTNELSTVEKELIRLGLGLNTVATGVNRGFAWKLENGRVSRTDSVVTSSLISYCDRDGQFWIFDAAKDRGRVGILLQRRRTRTNEEVFLSLVYELGNDPEAISRRTNLSVEEVLPMIAKVRSIPTLVIHPEERIKVGSTIEAFSKVRRSAQEVASQRGRLNGTIIMGDVSWRSGEYHLTLLNNHAVRDGVEGAALSARLADRLQEGIKELSADLPPESKAGEVIYDFSGDEELKEVEPELFFVNKADMKLGEIFPAKEELGGLPGEEVTFAVEVSHLWGQAERIAKEFGRYRDRKRGGEKTLLTSPYFVMEMMIQQMHQRLSGSKKVGVLLAKKGMRDLDLHPIREGVDVQEISELMRGAETDISKRDKLDSYLDGYMNQIKGALAVSNMEAIETVAEVAGPGLRKAINFLAKTPLLISGAEAKAGADMLSIIPGRESASFGVALDGPAMYEAQKRAIALSGWIRTKDGGMVMMVTIKRNTRQSQTAKEANQLAHDFAGRLYNMIDSREKILVATEKMLAARGFLE